MHQLVLEAEPTKFGLGGGLPGRIDKVLLKFSINPKQRRTGDIKFMNYRFERELHEEVRHYYLPHMIGYTLTPAYFNDEREYFQNTLVTLVRVGMREQHKKIKVSVSVQPSAKLTEVLTRGDHADVETNLNIDFRKAREFNRQTRLFMNSQEPNMSRDDEHIRGQKSLAKTIFNIEQVGTLINEATGTVNSPSTFSDNPVLLEHLLHELRLLQRSLQDDPPREAKTHELVVVDVAVTKLPENPRALESLKSTGKWLGSRAEKLGLSLLTEYLKQQAGL